MLVYKLMMCLLQVSKNRTSLYAENKLYHHSRSSFTHLNIFILVNFVAAQKYLFTKTQIFCINTFPSHSTWEQKKRNFTKDLLLKKITDCLAKTLLVALIAFSNFSSGSLAVNFLISISIQTLLLASLLHLLCYFEEFLLS